MPKVPTLHTPPFGPSCGLIKSKCVFVSTLVELKYEQERGNPGSLGPVTKFQGNAFFESFVNEPLSARKILEAGILKGHGELISFGDIHGDLLALLGVLRAAECIDDHAHWKKRESNMAKRCVVQLGDMLDRGGRGDSSVDTSHMKREELNIIEYLHALNIEASACGERVISLSGNHELYALRSSIDNAVAERWNRFVTPATAQPLAGKNRKDVLSSPGALKYFAMYRPLMAVSSMGWLFAHGDVPITGLRTFQKSHERLLKYIRSYTVLTYAESVVGAVNLLWACHVLEIGGDASMTKQLSTVLPEEERVKGFKSELSPFALAVCTCRTLATMGKPEGIACNCTDNVDSVGDALALDWTISGGIALGHTVNANISASCKGRLQLLDIGMSEAFAGFNKTGKVAYLRVSVHQTTYHGS
jgi:hypothetical protein